MRLRLINLDSILDDSVRKWPVADWLSEYAGEVLHLVQPAFVEALPGNSPTFSISVCHGDSSTSIGIDEFRPGEPDRGGEYHVLITFGFDADCCFLAALCGLAFCRKRNVVVEDEESVFSKSPTLNSKEIEARIMALGKQETFLTAAISFWAANAEHMARTEPNARPKRA